MDLLDKAGFHAKAVLISLGEAAGDALIGIANLVSKEAPKKAADHVVSTKSYYGSFSPGLSTALAHFAAAYLANTTFIPTGEAVGTGAAMVIYAKKGEEKTMGATALVAGTCSAIGMVGGVFAPKPTITITIPEPTTFFGRGGTIALGMEAVSFAVDAPAVGGVAVAAAINGGTMFMVGKPGDATDPQYPMSTEEAAGQIVDELKLDASKEIVAQRIQLQLNRSPNFNFRVISVKGDTVILEGKSTASGIVRTLEIKITPFKKFSKTTGQMEKARDCSITVFEHSDPHRSISAPSPGSNEKGHYLPPSLPGSE